jgi:hypothetical protein
MKWRKMLRRWAEFPSPIGQACAQAVRYVDDLEAHLLALKTQQQKEEQCTRKPRNPSDAAKH